MNIFVFDTDPEKCAQMHDDVRLRKMIVEYSQLLSTYIRLKRGKKTKVIYNGKLINWYKIDSDIIDESNNTLISYKLYKHTHMNHPCQRWVNISTENMNWLLNLLGQCLNEYIKRFDKQHKTEYIWNLILENCHSMILIKDEIFFGGCFCMPDIYKSNNIVNSYRNYFLSEKLTDKNGKFIAKWTNREVPEWVAKDERYLKFVGEMQNV